MSMFKKIRLLKQNPHTQSNSNFALDFSSNPDQNVGRDENRSQRALPGSTVDQLEKYSRSMQTNKNAASQCRPSMSTRKMKKLISKFWKVSFLFFFILTFLVLISKNFIWSASTFVKVQPVNIDQQKSASGWHRQTALFYWSTLTVEVNHCIFLSTLLAGLFIRPQNLQIFRRKWKCNLPWPFHRPSGLHVTCWHLIKKKKKKRHANQAVFLL